MRVLRVRAVATGDELDTFTLDDAGTLTSGTGAAQDMLDSWRARHPDDAAVYAAMAGWSNGYVQIVAGDAQPAEPEAAAAAPEG